MEQQIPSRASEGRRHVCHEGIRGFPLPKGNRDADERRFLGKHLLRKATIKDVEKVWKLVNNYADKRMMLPRSLSELYENLRDFYVVIEDDKMVGCGALHITWEDYGEILSLAVEPEKVRQGIGSKILKACEEEARALGLNKLITLTYVPEFFEKHGFVRVKKSTLPHKIWSMCIKCPKFPECDEIPLVKKIN